ncbi:protein-tyrosine phosphatase-like protein, partial [Gongronella butleri]
PSTPFLPSHETQSKYVDGPVMILPGVYLGDESNSLDLARLKDLSIQCMMNVAAEVQHPSAALFSPWHALDDEGAATSKTYHTTISSASSGMTLAPASSSSSSKVPMAHDDQLPSPMYYKKRPWHHHIQDNNDADVIQELHAAVIDIAHARQANKRVLVHCQCGLARSATVLIAYVMYTKQLTMQAALAHVKHRAKHINPNFSLMYHLREYEQWLR